MKIYLFFTLLSLNSYAGFFSSDYKLDNDPNCYLDLREVAGDYKETDFVSRYNPLTRSGAVNSAEPINVVYRVPPRHVFNCIVHKKRPDLRICEGGDEFEYKDGSGVYKTSVIRAKGKFFEVRGELISTRRSSNIKIDSDKITKIHRLLSCEERQAWGRKHQELIIRMFYNPMYIE